MNQMATGWYPDPNDDGAEIYWNGQQWHGRRDRNPNTPPTPKPELGIAALIAGISRQPTRTFWVVVIILVALALVVIFWLIPGLKKEEEKKKWWRENHPEVYGSAHTHEHNLKTLEGVDDEATRCPSFTLHPVLYPAGLFGRQPFRFGVVTSL